MRLQKCSTGCNVVAKSLGVREETTDRREAKRRIESLEKLKKLLEKAAAGRS